MTSLGFGLVFLILFQYHCAVECTGVVVSDVLTFFVDLESLWKDTTAYGINKFKTQQFITSKFNQFGLQVWTENFDAYQDQQGTNIVGVLWGERMLTPSSNNRLYIIGSHYDTQSSLGEGSGIAVLLDVAKKVAEGAQSCAHESTVMFVAWDYHYHHPLDSTPARDCLNNTFSCGASIFAKNLTTFKRRFDSDTSFHQFNYTDIYGTVGGIVDIGSSIVVNEQQNSQTVPASLINKTMSSTYETLKNNKFRGNFLGMTYDSNTPREFIDALVRAHDAKVPLHRNRIVEFNVTKATIIDDNVFESNEAMVLSKMLLPTISIGDMNDFRSFNRTCESNPCDLLFRHDSIYNDFMLDTSITILTWIKSVVIQTCVPKNIEEKYKPLIDVLKTIAGPRHDLVDAIRKSNAREYIKNELTKAGFTTWIEDFTTEFSNITGKNIVAKLTGHPSAGTYLVGAHYDTVTSTNGVDDNGSGVAALIRIAQLISQKSFYPNATIYLVSFDYEEWDFNSPCTAIGCGSRAFVANLTSSSEFDASTFHGAIILDTIMNFNDEPNTQVVPNELKLLPFYPSILASSFRGDDLIVIARTTDPVSALFQSKFNLTGSSSVDITLPPAIAPHSNVLRSDHTSFWNAGLSAVFLTDSANFRGVMRQCYHQQCDKLAQFSPQSFLMLNDISQGIFDTIFEDGKMKSASIHVAASPLLLVIATILLAFIQHL